MSLSVGRGSLVFVCDLPCVFVQDLLIFKSGVNVHGVQFIGHQGRAVVKLNGQHQRHACVVCKFSFVLGNRVVVGSCQEFKGYFPCYDTVHIFYGTVESGLIYFTGSQLNAPDPFAFLIGLGIGGVVFLFFCLCVGNDLNVLFRRFRLVLGRCVINLQGHGFS